MDFLYIDPGTGSMLFAILIGIAGAVSYVVRTAFVKLRFLLTGGRKVEGNADVIPFAIFSDDKRYWNVFEPICREFDDRGIDVVYFTASEDDPAFTNDFEHVRASFLGEGNKAFAKLNLLKADILLSTTPGLDVYQWKRSKDVKYYVHTQHAPNEVTLYRMFGLDYYDSILVGGEMQVGGIRALEELRGLPAKELPYGGLPYLDVMAQRVEAAGDVPAHKRTVLLAPSWGPSAIFSRFGGDIIGVLLDTGYQIVVRPHPQSFKSEAELITRIQDQYPESEQLSWNSDNDNFECLRNADILISDFSGVIFEFALVHDKPIIYTDPDFDIAPYDAWWLEEETWTLGALPRIGMQLTDERMHALKEMIDECLSAPQFTDGRNEVREEVWQLRGQGAARTVDYLVQKHSELTESKEGE